MTKLYLALLNVVAVVNAASFSVTEIDNIRTMILDKKSFTQSMDFIQQNGANLDEVFHKLVYIDFDQYDHVDLNNVIDVMGLDSGFAPERPNFNRNRVSRNLDILSKREGISQFYYNIVNNDLYPFSLNQDEVFHKLAYENMQYETVISWFVQQGFDSNDIAKHYRQDLLKLKKIIIGISKHKCFTDMFKPKSR
jgi:hypothetical protein